MTDNRNWNDISIYSDYHEGELVFETSDGKGIVEKQGDRFFVKLYAPLYQDWETTATWLLAEVEEIRNWAWTKAGMLHFKFKVFRDRIYENEKYAANDEYLKTVNPNGDDKRTHTLFQAWQPTEEGWRIYENEEEYLIMFVASYPEEDDKVSYDDLANEIVDSAWTPIRFFRAWYYRVNGESYEPNDNPEEENYGRSSDEFQNYLDDNPDE